MSITRHIPISDMFKWGGGSASENQTMWGLGVLARLGAAVIHLVTFCILTSERN